MIISGTQNAAPFALTALEARACAFALSNNEAPDALFCSPALWQAGAWQGLDLSYPRSDCRPLSIPDKLRGAVAIRRAEFLAGRLCAMLALEALSGKWEDIAVHTDRSPIWPAGFIGSISHTKSRAIALVASEAHYARLGVDLEAMMDEARAAPLARMIVEESEIALRPVDMPFAAFLTLIFSAKEAFYKAVYPQLRRFLGFHDVRLARLDHASLLLVPQAEKIPELAGSTFSLLWRFEDDHCLTVLAEPR
ncbi:MAG: 4'-phosphopantetheinyl transferase superfamily protein [Proteobacteria bacterium]|nr:4'-phosphopantetheinyl transferase superfamily protein [Pseudomonadota bacterium]